MRKALQESNNSTMVEKVGSEVYVTSNLISTTYHQYNYSQLFCKRMES